MNMSAKRAVSVTLTSDNLMWLKARAGAVGIRSVSELLDRLVAEARATGSVDVRKSVVGTIDVAETDPLLLGADQAVRDLYQASLSRPLRVAEDETPYRVAQPRRRRRG
jgi:hypothetical protein